MSSRTSLGQRNEMRMVRSNISSGFNLANQMSSKRLSRQFPLETYINIYDELNAVHIYEKCTFLLIKTWNSQNMAKEKKTLSKGS